MLRVVVVTVLTLLVATPAFAPSDIRRGSRGATENNDLETEQPPTIQDDEVYVGTGAGTGAFTVLPNCHTDNMLTYNQATGVFGCDADDGGGGGEANTISSQGGATALTAATPKSGVDLRIVSANATRFTVAADVLDIASVAGITGANEDNLSDDLITALSGVTTVADGSFCQGGAGSSVDCDVATITSAHIDSSICQANGTNCDATQAELDVKVNVGLENDEQLCTYELTGDQIDCDTNTLGELNTVLGSSVADGPHFTPTAGLSTDHGATAVGDTDIAAGAVDGGAGGEIADGSITTDDTEAALETEVACAYIETPAVEVLETVWWAPVAVTITSIYCETDAGTVGLDLQNDDGTPAGVNGSDISCAASGTTDSTFAGDATLAQADRLDIDINSVATAVQVSVCWRYTYD